MDCDSFPWPHWAIGPLSKSGVKQNHVSVFHIAISDELRIFLDLARVAGKRIGKTITFKQSTHQPVHPILSTGGRNHGFKNMEHYIHTNLEFSMRFSFAATSRGFGEVSNLFLTATFMPTSFVLFRSLHI
jgi:hypothetical protein